MEQSMSRVGYCIDNGPTEVLQSEQAQSYTIFQNKRIEKYKEKWCGRS